MVGAAQDPEVLNPIVGLVPVDVVDVLRCEQLSPEMLLHDKAMLADLPADPASDKDVAVTVGAACSPAEAVTQLPAEKSALVS